MNIKAFQKQYPDFDITMDVNAVAKELEKYRELSQVPKEIEEKREVHLSNLPDDVKEMSTREKIDFLNHERELWEQVAIQEKYGNLEEQNENSLPKKECAEQLMKKPNNEA